jgi:hypothetical protein
MKMNHSIKWNPPRIECQAQWRDQCRCYCIKDCDPCYCETWECEDGPCNAAREINENGVEEAYFNVFHETPMLKIDGPIIINFDESWTWEHPEIDDKRIHEILEENTKPKVRIAWGHGIFTEQEINDVDPWTPTNPKPTHSVSWALEFDGTITPTFACHAPEGAPCLHGGKHCSAVAYLMEGEEPMTCYRPSPHDPRKPLDGDIWVFWSQPHGEWHWRYPYAGPAITPDPVFAGLIEHLQERDMR